MASGHRPSGRSALTFPDESELSPEDTDRIIAILDRMLDLAVSLNWPVDRKEFWGLQMQLAAITGLASF